MKKTALLFFLALYTGLFFLMLPAYRYIIDPDATGYIKIAERIASADYARSINGLWSPLNAWLLVPLLKAGVNAVMAARYLNGIFGFLSVIAVFFLIRKFVLHLYAQIAAMLALIVVLLHYTFNELFADQLLVLMLLVYLNLLCSKNFIQSNGKVFLIGVIAAVGFYAKAYFLYFAAIHLAITFYILLKQPQQKPDWRKWLLKTTLAVATMIVFVIPWGFALKSQYGHFTFSTAGKYNQTWVLSPAYPQKAVMINPPHYADGYSFWDDPSYATWTNINPFTNKTVFLYQLRLLYSNTVESIKVFNDFSFLAMAVLLNVIGMVLARNKLFYQHKNNLVLFALCAIFPVGYIILHIEHRFFWILNIGLVLFAGIILTMIKQANYFNARVFVPAVAIVFGSFVLYPFNQLKEQYNSGKAVYEMAAVFKAKGIGGKIISNFTGYIDQANTTALCYWLTAQNYGPANIFHSENEILAAVKEYQINYYVMYYQLPYQKEAILSSSLARNALEIMDNIYPGVVVLKYH